MRWFQIDSWHIVDEATGRSHCGLEMGLRVPYGTPPHGEKTCETCLRHVTFESDPKPEKPAKARRATA